MRRRLLAWSLVVLTAPFAAGAREAPPVGQDPVIEQRMMALAEELRCLVCQNQTLADSNADLAEDLRNEIRALIREHKSDAEIRDYVVARYGDFVLYRPPLKGTTLLLWGGPFVLLLGGFAITIIGQRRRQGNAAIESLEPEERARIEATLNER